MSPAIPKPRFTLSGASSATGKTLRIALMALILVLMAGGDQPRQITALISREQAESRTAVPLVRPLNATRPGAIQFDFDVPALANEYEYDAEPPLFIGVRLTDTDRVDASDAVDRLRKAEVSAKVHLQHLTVTGADSVQLQRFQRAGNGEETSVALGADAIAPSLSVFDADVGTLMDAGMYSFDSGYRELAFANVVNLPAGRYRLSFELIKGDEALARENAQLFVAYTHRGK